MLVVARVLRLGFLGDFLSASVLIGFLTGVGIQVIGGQIPEMLGVPKGAGAGSTAVGLDQGHPDASLPDGGVCAVGTLVIILGFKRFFPGCPGAIVAVVLSSSSPPLTNAKAHGVAVVGAVQGGFPPVGLPHGISWTTCRRCWGSPFPASC